MVNKAQYDFDGVSLTIGRCNNRMAYCDTVDAITDQPGDMAERRGVARRRCSGDTAQS
jgi:hypothetical protein